MKHEINVVVLDMPTSIKAYTVSNSDGSYTIVLNGRHSAEQRKLSYLHEMSHITNLDFEKNNADFIELLSHFC